MALHQIISKILLFITGKIIGTADFCRKTGGFEMSKQGFMSEALKYEIAKRLGVSDTVSREGWGSVSSRNCGNVVREAIKMAEQDMN